MSNKPKPICVVYVDTFLLDKIHSIQDILETRMREDYFVVVAPGLASQKRAIELSVHYDSAITEIDISSLKVDILSRIDSIIEERKKSRLGKVTKYNFNKEILSIPLDVPILCKLDDGKSPIVLKFSLDEDYGIVAPFEESYIGVDRVIEWSIIPK